MHFTRRIRDRGTITVPKDVLEALGAKPGDILEIEVKGIHRAS